MFSSKMLLFWGLLICTAGLLLGLNACGGGSNGSQGVTSPSQKIQHVVIIFQENRTPDNLFQDPNLIAKGADIVNTGLNSQGQKVPLQQWSLVTDYDLSHAHKAFVAMYDGGKMDGADQIDIHCNKKEADCPSPTAWFRYVNPAEAAPYFQMAEKYVFGDRMFQTNQGPSFPSHQIIISGTSAPTPPGQPNSNFFAAENMTYGANAGKDINAGCIAFPTTTAAWIDPTGVEVDASPAQYPCYEHPTLTDLLNAKGISWRYYTPGAGSIWTGPNAIQHMCVPDSTGTTCTGSDWVNGVVLGQTQVLTDITNNQLPAVSWVIPSGQSSDHAGINDGSGPSWVASIVNAIGSSSYWSNTAIILTWDDWGGWYDHVAPHILNSYEYGFRVPLIVISPYAKAGYISHTVYDFGSILKFVEATFSLSTVAPGASPAYADTFTETGDLSDCFNFNQTPLTFQRIAAPLDAAHFLNDKSAALDPDDD